MKHIIIDTDPGVDDVLAILFALGNENLKIEGLTTVAGNVTVDKGTLNALRTLEIAGREEIPVARGAARPMRREQVTAEWVHGEDGLANLNLPLPKIAPVKESAVEWMRQKLLNSEEPITVVALGPLTNLGLLYALDPEAFSRIEEVIFMGGAAFCEGNTTASAEFNIYVDPDAAKLVVNSGVPLTMVGLDVTNQTIVKRDEIEAINPGDSETAIFVKKLMLQALDIIPVRVEMGGIALHDPLAIGAAARPDTVTTKLYNLEVETEGTTGLGATVADPRPWSEGVPNVKVAVDVDADQFKKWFVETVSR